MGYVSFREGKQFRLRNYSNLRRSMFLDFGSLIRKKTLQDHSKPYGGIVTVGIKVPIAHALDLSG